MSKRARALILGATLAAMNLASMTAVAHDQANDEPASTQDARRPPTEAQVGEAWRHRQVAPENQTTTDPAAERALARRRYWYYESMRTSRQETAADAALRQQLARERFSIPSGTPAKVPTPAPAEQNRRSGWLLASLGALTIVLALVGGLVVLTARRASRRARLGHAA